jgi:dUTP diphosphatase
VSLTGFDTFTVPPEDLILKVKKFHPDAQLPTVAHPGEDLGLDLYSVDSYDLLPNKLASIRTGIGVELKGYGFLLRDRSSLALHGIVVSGGVIDAGYRGELSVFLTLIGSQKPYSINKGDKVAQLLPMPIQTNFEVQEVSALGESFRGRKGFGSSGR